MNVSKVVFKDGTVLIDISDSTVAADKMLKGYKAYGANGEPIEGNIETYDRNALEACYGGTYGDNSNFAFDAAFNSPTLIEEEVTLAVPRADFGNATTSDVKKGKTFTSADGVNITGSYEEGYAITLPTRTVTVIDNDCAGDVVATALVNEGGKLVYKSANIPNSGAVTITYAWYTPIFITSKWVASVSVYDAEGDWIKNCPNTYDATNKTFAVFPQIDGGENHTVYVFQ